MLCHYGMKGSSTANHSMDLLMTSTFFLVNHDKYLPKTLMQNRVIEQS